MQKIKAILIGDQVFSNSLEAKELYEKSRFGERDKEKTLYMNEEALFLVETGKMDVLSSMYKELTREELLKKLNRIDKRFLTRYSVFSDLRKKGYVVKSALKFGGDFRVYDKGVKVGSGHSKWVCFCESESKTISTQDFAARNRVAHSTKKNLLFAVVDSENDVSYYEINWKRVV